MRTLVPEDAHIKQTPRRRRKPNYALLLPLAYAPAFPLLRLAMKGNPKLPMHRSCVWI